MSRVWVSRVTTRLIRPITVTLYMVGRVRRDNARTESLRPSGDRYYYILLYILVHHRTRILMPHYTHSRVMYLYQRSFYS